MTEFTSVKDSGERQEFDTGSVRDTREGKGRYDLIPPIALQRLARHFENGAVKYGDRNWEKGQPLTRYLDSAVRHIYTFLEGDRSEDHLAAGMWNIAAAIHTEEMIRRGFLPFELNDLPPNCMEEPIPEKPTPAPTPVESVMVTHMVTHMWKKPGEKICAFCEVARTTSNANDRSCSGVPF